MSENKKIQREHFAPGALTAPLPPVLVTVGDMECSNIITIAWTGILATTPPKTYISVRPQRHSYGILKEKGEFVINLPSASLAREVDYAGIYTGAKVDKFEKCGFTKAKSQEVAAPTIAECPIALECKVSEIVPMGSHDCFIADIVSVSCREDVLENGRICYDKADLLAYAHGEYYALGEKLGKFGFSTDKKKAANKPQMAGEKATVKTGKSEKEKSCAQRKGTEGRIASDKLTSPTDEPQRRQPPKSKKRGKKPFKKPQKSSIKL